MSENIIVPALGESITEAVVAKWLKKKGDKVEVDDPVVELETDKVNVEVPSPAEGVISIINFNNGDKVEVGASLGTISSQSEKIIPIGNLMQQYISDENDYGDGILIGLNPNQYPPAYNFNNIILDTTRAPKIEVYYFK